MFRVKIANAVCVAAALAAGCTDNEPTRAGAPPRPNAQVSAASASRIAFASDRDGNFEIYVMNADGTGQTRLTSNLAVDLTPTWSPDGQRIAFTTNRDGNDEIYVMNADGSDQTPLTNNPARDFAPAWSPDGQRIAFTSERDGDDEIYVMNADGSGQTRLTNAPGRDIGATWSPEGQRIAFAGERSSGDGPDLEIYVVNADGSGETRLTNHFGADIDPSWSPDGTRIAFVRDVQIYVMNADGSNPQNLTNTPGSNNFDPRWSPDGEQIAFSSDRDALNSSEVYVMNADGSAQTRLTSDPHRDLSPAWGLVSREGRAVGVVGFLTEPPAGLEAHAVISPAVRVLVKDRDGRLVQHAVVKMAIDDGASSDGRLFGTTVVETVDGVATFADLTIDQPGQYTLVARAGPVSAVSRSFTVE